MHVIETMIAFAAPVNSFACLALTTGARGKAAATKYLAQSGLC